MFREWLTAKDILRENLPGFRGSSRATIQRYLWNIRAAGHSHLWRQGKGRPTLPKRRGPREGQATEFHYSCLPSEAICAYEARYPAVATGQSDDGRADRRGKSVLMRAEDGSLRAFILQQLAASPRISASRIYALCIARFGADVTIIPQGLPTLVPMPPLRTFQQFISNLRKTDSL